MKRQDRTSGSMTYFAAYPMRAALTVFVCAVFGMSGLAEAQNNRGIGIGLGVAGALIALDKLSTGKGKKSKSSSSSSSKKSKSISKKKNDAGQTRSAKQSSGTSSRTAAKSKSQKIDDGIGERQDEINATAGQPVTTKNSSGTGSTASPGQGVAAASPVAVAPTSRLTAPASPLLISTPAEITAAQEHLKYLGYDVQTTSGTLDLNTRIAAMKYQDSIGAPATGELTVEQLQLLFRKAAEKRTSN